MMTAVVVVFVNVGVVVGDHVDVEVGVGIYLLNLIMLAMLLQVAELNMLKAQARAVIAACKKR